MKIKQTKTIDKGNKKSLPVLRVKESRNFFEWKFNKNIFVHKHFFFLGKWMNISHLSNWNINSKKKPKKLLWFFVDVCLLYSHVLVEANVNISVFLFCFFSNFYVMFFLLSKYSVYFGCSTWTTTTTTTTTTKSDHP